MTNTMKTDSLRRDDMAAQAKIATKLSLRTMHRVCVNGKWSTRVYRIATARKIVSRVARMGHDAYSSVFGQVWTAA